MHWKDYLQELSQVETLQPKQEAELWHRYKDQQDEGARQILIEAYQPLVFRVALPYQTMDCIMDIVQEGTVGLIEAAETFDSMRGAAFSLYAVHRIRGRIMNFLKKELCTEQPYPGTEDTLWSNKRIDDSPSVSDQAETHELIHQLHRAMMQLPQKERTVLEGLYLNSEEVRDMAEGLHLSVSHIYRLQKKGIRRVRGLLSRFMHQWN